MMVIKIRSMNCIRLCKKIKLLSVMLLLCSKTAYAQTYHQVNIGFNSVKDGVNNGMLFNGVTLGYQFGIQKNIHSSMIDYHADIKIGTLTSRGIFGLNLQIKPLSVMYGLEVSPGEKKKLWLGPRFEADYRMQIYPNLQMGHILWMTNYTLSPEIVAIRNLDNGNAIRLNANYAIAALSSRTQNLDPYFFSLRFGDIISSIHSNMNVVSVNNLTKFNLGLEYIYRKSKRDYSIGYSCDYLGYEKKYNYREINHLIIFRIRNK